MPTSTLAKHGWKLLFLVIAAFYLYGLGSLPLVGPDEPRYAQVAREMFERGDFITPTLGGVPWFEKPALLYWMMMASYRVFGVNEFAARLGPAMCGLLTAMFVYWLGASLRASSTGVEPAGWFHGRDIARWSAFVFLSSLGAIAFSRGASFDIVLTMTMTGAVCCFFLWHVRSTAVGHWKASSVLLVGFWIFIGLSLLAKGLVGFVLPLGIVAAFFLARREWPKHFLISLLLGLPLAVAVAGVWYGPMIYRHGWTFVDQFIVQHHFARFASNKYHHPQPFYFYLPVLALLMLPWTIVLIAAVAKLQPSLRRSHGAVDRLRIFAVAWIVVPLVFFSFSGSKIPGYIVPVMPAAALLTGMQITGLADQIMPFAHADRGGRVLRLTGILLLAGAAVGTWQSVSALNLSIGWAIAAALPILVCASVALIAPKRRALCFLFIGVTVIIVSAFALQPARTIASRDSVRDLMQMADARGYSSAPVFYFLCDERTAEFYAAGRVAYQSNGEPFRFEGAQDLPAAIRAKGDVGLVLMETRWEKQLTDYKAVHTERIGSNGGVSLFVVRPQ